MDFSRRHYDDRAWAGIVPGAPVPESINALLDDRNSPLFVPVSWERLCPGVELQQVHGRAARRNREMNLRGRMSHQMWTCDLRKPAFTSLHTVLLAAGS